MITKQFLETYPLLRKYTVTFNKVFVYAGGSRGTISNLPQSPINMYCRNCQSMQTFNMENGYENFSVDSPFRHSPVGKIFELRYKCASCGEFRYFFYVEFGIDKIPDKDSQTFSGWIRKIGQCPPWEIDINKSLEKALGKDSELYKKGLICESQSYGIGSYAYFRRITENMVDELLNSISTLIDPNDLKQYQEALEKVKKTRVTEEKIELVQDLLPSSIQPDGINPLKTLHSALSDGLHNKTDEECLALADNIKTTLTYLIDVIRTKNEQANNFTDKMKKLLDKK